jgi:hypothetical protein
MSGLFRRPPQPQQRPRRITAYVVPAVQGSFTADAVLKKTATPTFTADAVLRKAASGSLTANAVLFKTATPTFTANAALFKNSGTLTKTADAIRKRTFYFGSGPDPR